MMHTSSNNMGLEEKYWNVDPDTGIVNLTDEALKNLINPDPIEKWYQIDSEPIARGQFTVVYHCRNLITEGEYAAKFSSRWRLGVDCSSDLEHEIAVCAILRQPTKAVQLVDVFSTESEVILILEYAPGGDLQTLLDQDLVPFERNVVSFVRQILETLIFIHEKNIVHLDIKPQNLVLMGDYPDCNVKLCDFEISRILLPGRTIRDILGTADYIAPEIIHYEPITTKADMWSFGILTYVLLTGFLPFGGDTDQETFLEITRGKLDFPEELFEDISEQAIDFIKRLLLRQPHLRMSAKECLNHEWMKSLTNNLPKINITMVNSVSTNLSSTVTSSNVTPLQSNFSFTTAGNTFSLSIPSSPSSPQNLISNNYLSTISTASDDKFNEKLKDSLEVLVNSLKIENSHQGLGPHNLPRDTSLPPLKSYMAKRTSNHSSTSSLSKGGSRQSLDRIRSISKSREILFERLQKSSQRKILSRSRERLYDSKFGIYLSRDKLMDNRSISHSVETLPPSDLTKDNINSFYSSSGNVCALPVFSMLPLVEENNITCRQYRSMAAINNIGGEYKEAVAENRRKESVHSNFTYATKGYENLLSNKLETIPKDNKCVLKNQNNSVTKIVNEKKQTTENEKKGSKIKLSNQNRNKMLKSSMPTNNTDNSRRDNQKRRKEKDRSKAIKMKENNTITGMYNNNSNDNRRTKNNNNKGIGNHIEQRIQIRRTRKNNLNTKSENKVDGIRQNNILFEPAKKVQNVYGNKVNNNRNLPIKTNTNLQNTKKICLSQSPSTQVNTSLGVCANKHAVPFSPKIVSNTNFIVRNTLPTDNDRFVAPSCRKDKQNTKPLTSQERQLDIDEAYASLEDPMEEGIYESNHFSGEIVIPDASKRIENAFKQLSITDVVKTASMDAYNGKLSDKNENEIKYENTMECGRSYDKHKDPKGQDLTVIAEEEETVSITSYVRSVSTCSDISSVLSSEFSEEVLRSRRNSETLEMKNRRRSLGIQTPSVALIPDKLSRSKSLHLDSQRGKTRPWGDLCNGSVDRAYTILRQKSSDFIFVPRKNSDPTSNRPKSNSNEKSSRISFKNRLLKV